MQISFLGNCSKLLELAQYLEQDFSLTFFQSPCPFWSQKTHPSKENTLLSISPEKHSFRLYYSTEDSSHYLESLCIVTNFTFDHFYYPANSFLFKDKIQNGCSINDFQKQAILGDDNLLEIYKKYYPNHDFYPKSQYDLIFLDQPKDFYLTFQQEDKTMIKRSHQVQLLYRDKSLLFPFLSSYPLKTQCIDHIFFLHPEELSLKDFSEEIRSTCKRRLNALKDLK